MIRILVVDDDKKLNQAMCTFLSDVGFEAKGVLNASDAFDEMYGSLFDLIISDIMMPEIDGFEFAESVRRINKQIPILFVSAKDDLPSKQRGFRLGIDDYMVKPINIEEMLLRVQVLLRRSKSASDKKIQIGDLLLNYSQLSVTRKDKVYNLAQKEFYLLYKLLSTPNTIFTRQELIEEVWGLESESDYRTIDVHIKRIREKMEDVKEFEIVTIRGIGYKAIIHEKG